MSNEAAAATAHSSTEHEAANYFAVFIYLSVLTGAELLVYDLGFPAPIKVGLLVALAIAKATLVAMYFMHLAIEHKGLWIIAATPMVIVAWCYFMLLPDLSHRAWAHNPANQTVGVHETAG